MASFFMYIRNYTTKHPPSLQGGSSESPSSYRVMQYTPPYILYRGGLTLGHGLEPRPKNKADDHSDDKCKP